MCCGCRLDLVNYSIFVGAFILRMQLNQLAAETKQTITDLPREDLWGSDDNYGAYNYPASRNICACSYVLTVRCVGSQLLQGGDVFFIAELHICGQRCNFTSN